MRDRVMMDGWLVHLNLEDTQKDGRMWGGEEPISSVLRKWPGQPREVVERVIAKCHET